MLHDPTPAAEKRRRLRAMLVSSGDGPLVLPGVFNPLSALLAQRHGFAALYLSGAVMAADLGLPDVGLTTLSEVADRAAQVARVSALPLVVDADTGFGEPMNVARSVQMLEDAGVAGLHLEDQVNPKRCGHLEGKQVVDIESAQRRIRAAVGARRDPNLLVIARTDARAVEGLEGVISRARAYVAAGADAIFPEALGSEEEFATVRRALDVPLLANMTEFGQGPSLSVDVLGHLGYDMVIFPVSLFRLALGAADRALEVLAREGRLTSLLAQMQSRADLYDLVDYAGYQAFDAGVFTFPVPGPQRGDE